MVRLCVVQLVMLLWSYFSVVLTDPGSVPPNWRPSVDEERGESDPLNGSDFSILQSDLSHTRIRFCRKCNQPKPPRCHHCSVCQCFHIIQYFFLFQASFPCGKLKLWFFVGGRCVLKMDHHCVWVVNCVGALNYKYFLLFLVSYCLFDGLAVRLFFEKRSCLFHHITISMFFYILPFLFLFLHSSGMQTKTQSMSVWKYISGLIIL